VIFDPVHCPALLTSPTHSIFPIESVYGALSVKSRLNNAELKDAYENIASLKRIIIKKIFQHNPNPGFVVGVGYPIPVTGIVAYASDRSLEAIAAQVKALDAELGDLELRPDFVAVIGGGIVGPRGTRRGEFNALKRPNDIKELSQLRKTGRHTLLRIYMQITNDLNMITLRPWSLADYDNMPMLIGRYRVGGQNRVVPWGKERSDTGRVRHLTESTISKIVSESKRITARESWEHRLGSIPEGLADFCDLDEVVYEYNPNNLKPLVPSELTRDDEGRVTASNSTFVPQDMDIDGRRYLVSMDTFSESSFQDSLDFTVDEFMSY
jgi:hypothetical protein